MQFIEKVSKIHLAFTNGAINGPSCGTRPFASNIRDRIVGGSTAIEGDWGKYEKNTLT